MHALRQAEPDRPLRLELARQRAVVDQGAADGLDAAGRAERIAAHQHAAARRRRRGAVRAVHPGERVEHLEEKDEGRHKRALGEALAAQC